MTSRIAYCKCGSAIYDEIPLNSWNGQAMLERYFKLEGRIKKGDYITHCPGCGEILNQHKLKAVC